MENFIEKLKGVDKKVWIGIGIGAAILIILIIALVIVLGDKQTNKPGNGTQNGTQTGTETEGGITEVFGSEGLGTEVIGTEMTTETELTTETEVTESESQAQNQTQNQNQNQNQNQTQGNGGSTETQNQDGNGATQKPITQTQDGMIFGLGTKENPYEVIPDLDTMSVTTVAVPAGKTLYYNIQRVGGKYFTIEDKDAYVITSNGTRYDANGGKVSLQVENAMATEYVSFQIGNSGSTAKSFTIKFSNIKDTEKDTEVQLLSPDELEGVTFKRGDVFADMSVTTPEGTTYKISDILKEKKAVVLNFWFINCRPCEMEFPYMQDAYETYKDDIEILAVNPYDGTDETVADYKKKHELTFPMAAIEEEWAEYMGLTAYPTTVVVDRYGIISYVHTGMITEVEEFNKLFAFFTADDYEQTVIRNISDIK